MPNVPPLLVVLLLVVPRMPVAAQCDGKIVSAIVIERHAPTFLEVPRPLRTLARGVGLEHTTTRADVIRRFLALEVGQPCSAIRVAESQRILRFQPFLADATVRAVPDGRRGVRIKVETLDEIPTVFALRLRHWRPAELRLGDGNVAGKAVYVAARMQQGYGYRTGAGVQVIAYQALGRPYTLGLEAYRAPLGSTFRLAFGHAFLTDLQRVAWHVGYSNVNAYRSFVRPDSGPVALGVVRRFADIGSVRRIGVGKRIAFLGGLLTYERVTPASQAVVIADTGIIADPSAPIGGPFPRYENVRVNAVLGLRSLSFLEVRGFDALAAVQDVARGVQFGAVVGQGSDTFIGTDLYAGSGSTRSFAALRVETEARYDPGRSRWESVIASGRLGWYRRLSDAHIVIAGVEFSSGARLRTPFQFTLGAVPGGVRGYRDSRVVGAARSVARVEERWSFGRLAGRVGLGLATFADVGRVWAGDAPFGVNSGVKGGVGAGLLVAVPPQSKRLWRVDLAVPVSRDAHARWELRLTTVWVGGFWTEPTDVAQLRAGAAPSLIFTWP